MMLDVGPTYLALRKFPSIRKRTACVKRFHQIASKYESTFYFKKTDQWISFIAQQ
jgi:hypothetical protein